MCSGKKPAVVGGGKLKAQAKLTSVVMFGHLLCCGSGSVHRLSTSEIGVCFRCIVHQLSADLAATRPWRALSFFSWCLQSDNLCKKVLFATNLALLHPHDVGPPSNL